MENDEISRGKLTNKELVPNLLELKVVAKNPESESTRMLIYCPPIMGSSMDEKSRSALAHKVKVIYTVDVQKYGYPNFDQYTLQTKQQLEQLTDFDPENLVIVGFSEGASLAARLGQVFELPKNSVFLLAPVTSFRPSLDRWKAWKEQRRSRGKINQSLPNEEPYLKRLFGSPERIYSPSATIMPKIDQFKALNRSRVQWSCNEDDLSHGLVVTGNRDFISPPGRHSSVNIDASHTLSDYTVFLNEIL